MRNADVGNVNHFKVKQMRYSWRKLGGVTGLTLRFLGTKRENWWPLHVTILKFLNQIGYKVVCEESGWRDLKKNSCCMK